jgi:hypothetical protein
MTKIILKQSKVYRVYIDIIAPDETSAWACADSNADEELRERGTLGDSDCFRCIEIKQDGTQEEGHCSGLGKAKRD